MSDQQAHIKSTSQTADVWEEAHHFAEELTNASSFSAVGSSAIVSRSRVTNIHSLREFLQRYRSEVLIPFELPAIHEAYQHANRYEIRELIAADQKLSVDVRLAPFANASRHIGKMQLKRLRPLRDQKVVQRYLKAIEEGKAEGWHTVVYGLILSIYSFPLRQGLLNYAKQTLGGFIYSANRSLMLLDRQCQELHEELCLPLPQSVESLVRPANLADVLRIK